MTAFVHSRKRQDGLEIFLTEPSTNTNPLKRTLCAIPADSKVCLFLRGEPGAKHVGFVQRIIVTCRLRGVDPVDCLSAVLQRVAILPAARRLIQSPWKPSRADYPLRYGRGLSR